MAIIRKSILGGQAGNVLQMRRSSSKNYPAAIWAGFLGGHLASLVKWGTEIVMPPRTADRAVPPIEVLRACGLNVDHMTYCYSGQKLNYGSAIVHHAFSVVFGMLYAGIVERNPQVGRYYGTIFGLELTAAFHGVLLPLAGLSPPLWELPGDEITSELIGHLAWIWAIEIVRRDLRGRIDAPSD